MAKKRTAAEHGARPKRRRGENFKYPDGYQAKDGYYPCIYPNCSYKYTFKRGTTRHILRYHEDGGNDAADEDGDGDRDGEAQQPTERAIEKQIHVGEDGADEDNRDEDERDLGQANQPMGNTSVDEDDECGDDGDEYEEYGEDGNDEDEGITSEDQPDDGDQEAQRTTTGNTIIARPQLNELVSILQGDKDKLAAYWTQAGPTAPYGDETINGYISWLPQRQDTFVFPLHVLERNTDTPVLANAHNYLVFPFRNGEDWYGGFVDRTRDKMTVFTFLDSNDLNNHVEDVPKIYLFLQENGYLRDESFIFVKPLGLPRQKNSQDSGVFFLKFLERFLQDRGLFFEQIGKKESLGWVVADDARSEISNVLIRPLLERMAEKTREYILVCAYEGCKTVVGSKYAAVFKEILRNMLFRPAETTTKIVTASLINRSATQSNMIGEDTQDISATGLPRSLSDFLPPDPQSNSVAALPSNDAQRAPPGGVDTNQAGLLPFPVVSPSGYEASLVRRQTPSGPEKKFHRISVQYLITPSEGDNKADNNPEPRAKRQRLDASQGIASANPTAQNAETFFATSNEKVNSSDVRSSTGHQSNNANTAASPRGVAMVSPPQAEAQDDNAGPSIQNPATH